jgi:hypothetical protein
MSHIACLGEQEHLLVKMMTALVESNRHWIEGIYQQGAEENEKLVERSKFSYFEHGLPLPSSKMSIYDLSLILTCIPRIFSCDGRRNV